VVDDVRAVTPFNEFLHSVQDSFAANRSTNWARVGLVVVFAAAIVFGLSIWMRRRRIQRALAARIQSISSAAKLSDSDLDDLTRIAAAGQVPVIEVMTVLASFEHATAKLLATETPSLRPADRSWFERVRRLRKLLGFSPLSPHLWLLSTRELVVGDSVSIGGIGGHVVQVNEASFAVDWPQSAVLVEGALCTVMIDRPDDARYRSQVRLSRLEALAEIKTASGGRTDGRRAFFAHDEQPERHQDRQFTRLRANAAVRVQILDVNRGTTAPPPSTSPGAGTIVDISAGGMALDLPVSAGGPIARGAQMLCWFTLDNNATFDAVAAVVMAAGPAVGSPPGDQHLRLSFVALNDAERDRLAAAVARHQGAPPPLPASGSSGR
jgi:hypothetical protein